MSRRRLVLEAQIAVADWARHAPDERHAEELGKAEVRSLRPLLVAERRLPGRDEAAAGANERGELRALSVRERRDVGQHERAERREARRVELLVVDQLERDARLDERLVDAECCVLDPLARALAAVEPGCLLRVDDADAGERALVAQVAFGAVAEAV